MSFSTKFVITLFVYVAALILIGYLSSYRRSSGKNFISGGKSLSFLPLIGTIGATMIGVGLSIGATANGYLYGWGGSVFALGSSVGLLTLLIFTPMRRHGFDTMAEEAQFYYGGKVCVRNIASVMMLLSEIIWTGSAINGSAQYLCYIMDWSPILAKTVITLASFSFTIFGGTIFGVVYLVVPAANAWCFATFGGAAIPATLLAAALCFVVSLCTPANTLSEEERLKMVFATRRRGPEEPENG